MKVRLVVALVAAALGFTLVGTVRAAQPTVRPTDEERGEELYRRHCVQCHGARNQGDGPATRALVRPVPDLRGKVNQSDATLLTILRGKGGMPGYEASFDRPDARRVARYMASLGDDKAMPPEPSKPVGRPVRPGPMKAPARTVTPAQPDEPPAGPEGEAPEGDEGDAANE